MVISNLNKKGKEGRRKRKAIMENQKSITIGKSEPIWDIEKGMKIEVRENWAPHCRSKQSIFPYLTQE